MAHAFGQGVSVVLDDVIGARACCRAMNAAAFDELSKLAASEGVAFYTTKRGQANASAASTLISRPRASARILRVSSPAWDGSGLTWDA